MKNFSLKVIPLGGLGEIGRNMMVLEYGDDIIVIDSGVSFRSEEAPGVDLVFPDITYLLENKDKIKGILITHGHEDHTGALPYVLSQINVPVYAPGLACGLIGVKLKEHALDKVVKLHPVLPRELITLGAFRVEFYRVCHSIPDAMGLAINTPIGLVVHTGDFKIDHTPIDGKRTDLARLAEYGSDGVILLLSDSTYAELEGYTPSEKVVGFALDSAIRDAPGRVLVTTFASLISRIQQVLDAAVKYDRKVGIVGRSMVGNVDIATEMGYLSVKKGVILPLEEVLKLPHHETVLLTTGSQGEPTSALVRMAGGYHRQVHISSEDTIIISATPIPGNEKLVSRSINNLMRQGARVLYDKVSLVHVHGHASREELKIVINLTKPRYMVPVHGEYRHLVAHSKIACDMGLKESDVFILEDGNVLEINSSGAHISGKVPAGQVYLDGKNIVDMDSPVLRDRRILSKDGAVVVIFAIDKNSHKPLGKPELVSTGFVDNREDVLDRLSGHIFDSLDWDASYKTDDQTSKKLKAKTGQILYKETGQRPVIIPVIVEV